MFDPSNFPDHSLKNDRQRPPWLSYRVKFFPKVANVQRRKAKKIQLVILSDLQWQVWIWWPAPSPLPLTDNFRSCLGNHRWNVNCLYRSIPCCSQRNYRWPYFHNAVKIISETLCKIWKDVQTGNCYRCGNVLSATLKSVTLLRWQSVFIQLMV